MRLFISIEIPESIKNKIKYIQQDLKKEPVNLTNLNQIHITLKFLGEVPETKIDEIIKALSKIKFNKFDISVKRIGFFPSENFIRVVWIGSVSEEQNRLAKKINKALSVLGFKQEKFTGHITLARVYKKINIKEIKEKHKKLNLGKFTVDEFYLMQSTLKKPRAIHKKLKKFNLS